MIHRPWPIVVIGVFHILSPLTNFWMSAHLVGMSVFEYLAFESHHKLLNLIIWMLPMLAGIALLTFRMWSYYLFLAFMAGVSIFTLYERLAYPHRVGILLFLGAELINFLVIIYFLSPPVKKIYLNKRIRWWQQKPRYAVHWPCGYQLISSQGEIQPVRTDARIDNLSEGGAYIKTPDSLKTFDYILVSFQTYGKEYSIKSRIVHDRKDGYGVLFQDTVPTHLKLKSLLGQLKRENFPVRGQNQPLLSSFKFWFFDLFKTGNGIFPDSQ